AIEAARAGEQGRGFSVVADEVRILAEKTATATAEIGGMIQSVQQRTGDAVNAMESGAREVIAGLENARSAGESLQQIVASAEQMTTMVQDIATATRKQGADVASVRRHTGDIGALIGDTLRNTREGADQAARLDELAGSLDNTVTAFKLA
ncbi:MAG TPA: methyl-accepting chemotaxis protein, partial [Betaproteobacteria bacterium]|nr:methyl-accepting chemotaxis protein [Betaproteobacteria bacterium]